MKKAAREFFGLAIMVLVILQALAGLAMATSLYAIVSINANPTPINAYNINPDGTLTFQQSSGVPAWDGGAVGITVAIDVDTTVTPPVTNETLFITYEFSSKIQLVNAKNMADLGYIIAPIPAGESANLAGIVFDQKKKLLYAVNRQTSSLFVYSWNSATKTLTLKGTHTLANVGGSGAFGIGLDTAKDQLYVANLTSTIPFYNTSDWSKAGEITAAGQAINVAIDAKRRYLFSGAGWGVGNEYLDRYNLNDGTTKRSASLGAYIGVHGLGVFDVKPNDPAGGYVYITTGRNGTSGNEGTLRVYDADLNLIQNIQLPPYSGPTGLVIAAGVGVNPMNLKKDATGFAKVQPGATITYTISFDNKNNPFDVQQVTLKDDLPAETTFVSATGGGVYDSETHTVNWNIGTVPAGAGTQSVLLKAKVKSGTAIGTVIDNVVTLNGQGIPASSEHQKPISVVTQPAFTLAFPIPGYTYITAPLYAVLDHSVFETTPVKFYEKDDKVKAYNGQVGEKIYGEKILEGSWSGYMNSLGTRFLGGLNYLQGRYLFYDGHSGYDYKVPIGTAILATAKGRLRKCYSDPVNGLGWSAYKTFLIKHLDESGKLNGYSTWYLYVNLNADILSQIQQKGYADVTKGQEIGKTYNKWFHLDFRKGGINPENVIDPFKPRLWE
jgi:uncharacterized repeat protein (TIGR01451 family)